MLVGETVALATAVAMLAGVPLAWILQNRQFPGKRAVSAIATAAMALPAPLLCYYLLVEWSRARSGSFAGLVGAGVLSVLPFVVRRMRAYLALINPSYGKAARSLGISEWRVFTRVDLPWALAPMAGAAGWAVARLLLELGAARWIAELRS